MHKWKQAALTKEEKEQIKTNPDPITCRKQIEEANRNTWTHPSGQIRGQIDYIMVNTNYRNSVTKAWAEQGWRGNMVQQRHHATIRMYITLRLAKHYHKNHNLKQENNKSSKK